MFSEFSISLGDGISVDIIQQDDKMYRYEIRDEYYEDHRLVGAFGLSYLEEDVDLLRFIYDSMAKEYQLFFNR